MRGKAAPQQPSAGAERTSLRGGVLAIVLTAAALTGAAGSAEASLELTVKLDSRHVATGDPSDSSTPVVFSELMPLHVALTLRVPWDHGESDGGQSKLQPVTTESANWWEDVRWTLNGEAWAAPTLRPDFVPHESATHRFSAGWAQSTGYVTGTLAPGRYEIRAELRFAEQGPVARSEPLVLRVRVGTGNPEWASALHVQRRRMAWSTGGFPAFEAEMLDRLAEHPTSAGWELLADRSILQGDARKTAEYYARARAALRRAHRERFAGEETIPVKACRQLELRLAGLSVFSDLMPFLDRGVWLVPEPVRGRCPVGEYYLAKRFRLHGPDGLRLTVFRVDDEVLDQLPQAAATVR